MLGLGNSLIRQPPPPTATGFSTSSVVLDGTNDYLSIPDNASINMGTEDYSISAWVNLSNANVSSVNIFEKNTGSSACMLAVSSNDIYLYIENASHDHYSASNAGGRIGSGDAIANNVWSHILGTFDRDGNATGYVNGSSVGTVDISVCDGKSISNSSQANIGTLGEFSGWANGNIDDVAIWKGAILSSDDAVSIYNGGKPNDLTDSGSYTTDRTSELVGYWKFEEGSGTTVADSSSNSNTATLVNEAAFSTTVP